jgi:hypothetical protein
MTRADKIALLAAAFAGNVQPIRQYKQEMDRVNGGGIYEPDPITKEPRRIFWTKTDGTRVIDTWSQFQQREMSEGMILIPDNGREDYFETGNVIQD